MILSMKSLLQTIFLISPLLFGSGCATLLMQAEPPEILVVNIKPLGGTLFEQRIQVDLRVRNPNNFDLDVSGLDFTLQLNHKKISRGLASQSVTIPRLGDALLTVDTTTSTLEVLSQLLHLTSGEDITYQISGILHLQDIPLPFDNEGVILHTRNDIRSSPEN
jgi:LEA14-like dessication related protein